MYNSQLAWNSVPNACPSSVSTSIFTRSKGNPPLVLKSGSAVSFSRPGDSVLHGPHQLKNNELGMEEWMTSDELGVKIDNRYSILCRCCFCESLIEDNLLSNHIITFKCCLHHGSHCHITLSADVKHEMPWTDWLTETCELTLAYGRKA